MHQRPTIALDPLRRRDFLLGAAATALLGASVGCAGKKDKGPKDPGSATAQMGKGLNQLRQRIKKHVADESRRDKMLALVDQAEVHLTDLDAATMDWRAELAKLPDADVSNSGPALKVCQDYNTRLSDSFLEACKRSIEMRQHTNPEEWALIFPGPKQKKGEA